ncbi:MAG TPA: TonB family protein [Rhodanobacteraceae bacterium]|nr:TonB family protein [Rhodanobacteraceae bacterium]
MGSANARPYLLMILFAVAVDKPLHAADDQVHVVPASELEQWWHVEPRKDPEPPYPIEAAQTGEAGCIAVAFEVHGDGNVSNERAWRSTLTDSPAGKLLIQGALQAMHQWRFVPAPANAGHDAVYTYHVFTYGLTRLDPMPGTNPIPNASDRRRADREDYENKAQCEISDFPQQVQAIISAAPAKGGTQ